MAYSHSAPLVSIIMPVYNAAPYLRETIASIIDQTTHEWELLCIDDGSTDNSFLLLQELALQEPRLRVIHQSNAGVSAARNKGIALSYGDWLMMMDSDDTISPTMLEELLAAAQSSAEIDIVATGYDERHPDSQQLDHRGALLSGRNDRGVLSQPMAAEYLHAACWGKLYKKELITKHHLTFDTNLPIGEDHAFVLNCTMHARSIYVLQRELYHYIHREGSAIERFDAGILPRNVYIEVITAYTSISNNTLSLNWTQKQRKAFNSALLAHYLRVFEWICHVFNHKRPQEATAIKRELFCNMMPLLCRSGLIGSLRMLKRHLW